MTETNINLHLGDCLDVLSSMESNSIDLVVTSPPYDDLRNYNDSLEWNYDIFKKIATELYRTLKTGGVIVWVVGDATIDGSETGTSFKQALFFKELGLNIHDTMIYEKNSMPKNSNRYEQYFEYMFVFSKGKPNVFNPIMIPCTYAGVGTSPTTRNKDGELISKGRRTINNTKVKGNIWKYQVGKHKSTSDLESFEHPAIFPEQLVYDHIKTWSNENDIVLDPFMGSGTTGKMSVILKRRFIGIEKVEKYYSIAERRINNYTNNLDFLFGE